MSHQRRAFTLIELLVVIAIIAILAAILFPVFAQAKNAAKKTQDLSNVKQIALGTLMYAGDHDDVMPVWGFWQTYPDGDRINTWRTNTIPYIKSQALFSPPNFPKGSESGWARLDYATWYQDSRLGIPLGIAGIHSWAHGGFAPNGRNLSEVTRPAGLLSIATSRFPFGDVATWTINKTWFEGRPEYPGKGTYVAYNRVANWGFFDGHAKAIHPCATFGALNWNNGETPADDFLWEWWQGPWSSVLREWKHGNTVGYNATDWGCDDIDEYAK